MGGRSSAVAGGCWLAAAVSVWLWASLALGQSDEPFAVPLDPRESPPRWVFEVHLDGIFPIDVDPLCPEGIRCVYEGGAGVGASAERRWPQGFGVFGGYDAWFIDSSSVFELGVQQGLAVGFRYTVPNAAMVHPVFDLSAGASLYGDTFRLETAGLMLTGKVGLQFELSRFFGVLGAVGVRAFSHGQFVSQRDMGQRGAGGAFNEALFLQVALTIDGRPWAAAEP